MRKLLTSLAAIFIAALSGFVVPMATAGPAGRAERAMYDAPGGVPGVVAGSVTGTRIGSVEFSGGRERFVSVEITDATGLPVAADVVQFSGDQNVSTDSSDATTYSICGASERPLRIRRFVKVYVFIYAGPCADGTLAAATTGTVTARFESRV